jgi:hypothetical protein
MYSSTRLPRLILGFWTAWYFVVVASNVCDFARSLGGLPANWSFVSGNLELVRRSIGIYGLPDWVAMGLFAAAIAWEFAATISFAQAARQQCAAESAWPATERALLLGLGLWAAFILADEIFITYPTGLEAAHLRILVAHLASLIAVRLLLPPHDSKSTRN